MSKSETVKVWGVEPPWRVTMETLGTGWDTTTILTLYRYDTYVYATSFERLRELDDAADRIRSAIKAYEKARVEAQATLDSPTQEVREAIARLKANSGYARDTEHWQDVRALVRTLEENA